MSKNLIHEQEQINDEQKQEKFPIHFYEQINDEQKIIYDLNKLNNLLNENQSLERTIFLCAFIGFATNIISAIWTFGGSDAAKLVLNYLTPIISGTSLLTFVKGFYNINKSKEDKNDKLYFEFPEKLVKLSLKGYPNDNKLNKNIKKIDRMNQELRILKKENEKDEKENEKKEENEKENEKKEKENKKNEEKKEKKVKKILIIIYNDVFTFKTILTSKEKDLIWHNLNGLKLEYELNI
ncbi:hypothetical protein F8M41_010154 [Gigaspora margarita]|uniref:Uncharacterized protein n=1 Tax=Gigaspora margarita TaxID=4874 RepID=A0A8H4A2N2_GIGMA|nr:hypothetical protein F8M41_010154 [Gigaspora margarita]